MNRTLLVQVVLLLGVLTAVAVPLGEYMAKVFTGKPTLVTPLLLPLENFFYKLFHIDPTEEMEWQTFLANLLLFNLVGLLVLFLLQELQGFLPLNPEKFKAVPWDSALNSALSFVTHTNWQPYLYRIPLSYLTHLLGLGVQNFLAGATSIAVALALINAFRRNHSRGIGNFWVYLTRALLYVLLPLATILALLLISQGVVNNLSPPRQLTTLEGHSQVIAQGPAAAQVAIKHISSGGGGFFAANSAHPYENPTPLSDYCEILAMLLIAAAFPFTFGALLQDRVQGWALFSAMVLLFLIGLVIAFWSELAGNPLLANLGVTQGINMEGKEMRCGIAAAVFSTNTATATATGAVNSALSSLMPLTNLVALFNIIGGGAIFGGIGSGFVTILFYALLTMFLIGLMSGKTPELYGKRLTPREMVLIVIALFLPYASQLSLSALAVAISGGGAAGENSSPHELVEIIYTYVSTMGLNGSAMAGLKSNTLFYNLTTAAAMLGGRLINIIVALALAGTIAQKKLLPRSSRFPTTSPIFIAVLVAVVLCNGILTFFPLFVLGPVLEYLTLMAGQIF